MFLSCHLALSLSESQSTLTAKYVCTYKESDSGFSLLSMDSHSSRHTTKNMDNRTKQIKVENGQACNVHKYVGGERPIYINTE